MNSAGASSSSPFPPKASLTPTDTVSYSLFPDDPTSLHSLHLQIITQILPSFIPSDYIWQHEPFHLSPSLSPLPHLRGSTRFGDNLDDEWLIASLLLHISRQLPRLSIHLHDSDGDFLLIEAAFHLPRWLRPDNSLHRVFLCRGLLHIIPLKPHPNLTLTSALDILKSGHTDTVASEPVQAAIVNKTATYPEKAIKNMHRVRVRVPASVAQVLKHEPSLNSLAVEGFYDRDVVSMKDAARMERFGEGEMVRVRVSMTRVMYGQFVEQSFQAPRGYPMPARGEVGREGFWRRRSG